MNKVWIAKQMKKARSLSGITQKEMAIKMGVSLAVLLRLESGENEVSYAQMLQWARVTGYPLVFFIPDGWFEDEEMSYYDRLWDKYVEDRAKSLSLIVQGHLELVRDTLRGDVLELLIGELNRVRRECL